MRTGADPGGGGHDGHVPPPLGASGGHHLEGTTGGATSTKWPNADDFSIF